MTTAALQLRSRLREIIFCRLRKLQTAGALLVAALTLTLFAGNASAAALSDVHVYLMRGAINIFSLGMDEIADKLHKQGINATVHNHLAWRGVAAEAAEEYKSGQVKTIIIVGHSQGATILPDIISLLDSNGVPVTLAISLDSWFSTTLSGHADHYINYYVGNGLGAKATASAAFHGTLENVDVENLPGISHASIDKNDVMQEKVISAIDAIALGPIAPSHRQPPAVH